MSKFKPGNVVCLNSGGPLMVIGKINPSIFEVNTEGYDCFCQWIGDDGNPRGQWFREEMLTLVKKGGK